MSHNYCRSTSLNLYEYNKEISNATFHIFFNATDWKFGPWCYVNKEDDGGTNEERIRQRNLNEMLWPDYYLINKSGQLECFDENKKNCTLAKIYPDVVVDYEPRRCFDKCDEIVTTTRTTTNNTGTTIKSTTKLSKLKNSNGTI
ncbi:unnamed protein product [Meloidogyne enterolobii]|uniref:Uncharacterized protein n=1 Tax=Meloidogyne enterolobii TaxID=390850 RepID=A0ACB0YC45_MELEN